MAWEVEYADEFESWWHSLNEEEQDSVAFSVRLLEEYGPMLGRPHVDTLELSAYPNMKELRIQHAGRPYRVIFAFDPRRAAYLIIGGDKVGNERWYDEMVPKADAIFAQHLKEIGTQ